jgi:hypothetical protein
MELHVELYLPGEEGEEIDQVVSSLSGIDKIAARVGRSVRDYLRTVPVRAQAASFNFAVKAQWHDAAPAPATNGKQPHAKKRKARHGAS